jgi:lipoate---protein ligase
VIEIVSGDAGSLHARDIGDSPRFGATWNVVTAPALVLGSTQPESTVDAAVAEVAGITVVRRRSGGGAVLMMPGEMCWLDVVVPRTDRRWSDDVGQSMWWVGEVWAKALASIGVRGAVHRGGLVGGDLGRLVCFAGHGAGEVLAEPTAAGRQAKLVGISQRRTRVGAKLQCSVHLAWRPQLCADLIVDPTITGADLAAAVATVDASADEVLTAVASALADS